MKRVAVFLLVLGLLLNTIQVGASSQHYISFLKRLDKNGYYDQTFRLPEKPFVENREVRSGEIYASPDVLEKNGDLATVSWTGVENVKSDDWIGIYISPDHSNQNYLDFFYVEQCPTYAQGFGNVSFSLTNLRKPFQFRYFQIEGSDSYKLIATSNVIHFKNLNEPLQGHIALGNSIDEMRVMFTTNSWDTPMVEYGTSSQSYTNVATGISTTYSADMMCSANANRDEAGYFIDPGVLHDVLLTKLEPSTKYYYRYGTSAGWSEERFFRTPPLPGTPKVRLVAYGDLGVITPGPRGTVDLVYKEIEETDLILHFGDISYALGHGFLWEQYQALIEPIASRTPYMVSIGNHEYCYLTGGENDPSGAPGNGFHPIWGNYGNDSGGECGVPMFYRYHMPDNGNSLFWYSFNYGNVHIIQMSTEHDFTKESPQYIWMENDLKSVNRTETPFILFTGHRPMYNSEIYPSDWRVSRGIQAAFENLLIEYQVDMTLWGHYHSYERTCPVNADKCQENGVIHITVGSAGAWLDHVDHYDVPWSVYTDQSYGYCRVLVDENELVVEFMRNEDEAIVDSVTVKRKTFN